MNKSSQRQAPFLTFASIFSFVIISAFLPFSAQSEEACVGVQKNLKRTEMSLKNSTENIFEYQKNVQEMNNYSNGKVMKTVGWTIETTFFFSARETKELISNFFKKRLSVNQNYRLPLSKIGVKMPNENLSIEQNLANILAESQAQSQEITAVAQIQTASRLQAVQKEINDLAQAANFAAEGNIRKFGEVAISIVSQEIHLAQLKADHELIQSQSLALSELKKAKCH